MAGRGLAWPRACRDWLPVWLPRISLATLMFERSGPDALSSVSRAWLPGVTKPPGGEARTVRTRMGGTPAARFRGSGLGNFAQAASAETSWTRLGFDGQIARKGVPAPVQAGTRWVVERTHAWMNGYGKLRRCTERAAAVVDFYLYPAAAIVTIRQIIQRARTRYRWDTRPTTKRLK
jgi:hypothetical protein